MLTQFHHTPEMDILPSRQPSQHNPNLGVLFPDNGLYGPVLHLFENFCATTYAVYTTTINTKKDPKGASALGAFFIYGDVCLGHGCQVFFYKDGTRAT